MGQDGLAVSEFGASGFSYWWFRNRVNGEPFIACRDNESGNWFLAGLGFPVEITDRDAVMLGPVPRQIVGAGSVDN